MKLYEQWWERHISSNLSDMEQWFGGDGSEKYRAYPRKLIRSMKYKSLLDGGSGLCAEYYGFKKDYPELHYEGVEITPTFVEIGRKKGIQIVEGSLERLPFPDDTFDCVYIRDTLRHLSSYEKAIQEGFRVSRKEVMIVFARPLLKGNDHNILYEKDKEIYNNQYSQKLITNFLKTKPEVAWFYFESIPGRKRHNSLLRAFKDIPAGKKKQLMIQHAYHSFIWWPLYSIGNLVKRALRKIVRITLRTVR